MELTDASDLLYELPYDFDLLYDIKTMKEVEEVASGVNHSATPKELIDTFISNKLEVPECLVKWVVNDTLKLTETDTSYKEWTTDDLVDGDVISEGISDLEIVQVKFDVPRLKKMFANKQISRLELLIGRNKWVEIKR